MKRSSKRLLFDKQTIQKLTQENLQVVRGGLELDACTKWQFGCVPSNRTCPNAA